MPRVKREPVQIAGVPVAEFVDILTWDLVHATGGAEPLIRSFVEFRLGQCAEEIEKYREAARTIAVKLKSLEKRYIKMRRELAVERATLKIVLQDCEDLREIVEKTVPESEEVKDGRRGPDGRYRPSGGVLQSEPAGADPAESEEV